MKLSEYARCNNISYRTAHRHWKQGLIQGKQLASGTIVVNEEISQILETTDVLAVLYARVSNGENKANLETQLDRLRSFANAKGYTIVKEIKEIGSGLNDKRPQLERILQSGGWNVLLVEDKDRLARFGLNYLQILLEREGRKVEIINNVLDSRDDLMQDFVSIITSFTARLYGLRRSKRKTEAIIKELETEKDSPD